MATGRQAVAVTGKSK